MSSNTINYMNIDINSDNYTDVSTNVSIDNNNEFTPTPIMQQLADLIKYNIILIDKIEKINNEILNINFNENLYYLNDNNINMLYYYYYLNVSKSTFILQIINCNIEIKLISEFLCNELNTYYKNNNKTIKKYIK